MDSPSRRPNLEVVFGVDGCDLLHLYQAGQDPAAAVGNRWNLRRGAPTQKLYFRAAYVLKGTSPDIAKADPANGFEKCADSSYLSYTK